MCRKTNIVCWWFRRLAIGLAIMCFHSSSVQALDPKRAVSEYIHSAWNVQQGFPGGSVYAITQTPDGYLWLGTEKGLIRFDGLNFQLFNQTKSPVLDVGSVIDLMTDGQGNVWIRSQSRNLLRYTNGEIHNVTPEIDPHRWGITAMCRGTNGQPFFALRTSGVYTYSGGTFSQVISTAAIPTILIISMAQSADGNLWIGSRDLGLFKATEGRLSAMKGLSETKINSLLVNNSELWIGTDNGMAHYNGKEISKVDSSNSLKHVRVLSLTKDSGGNIWAGSSNGLVRLNADAAGPLAETDHSSSEVNAIFEDRERNLWIGNQQGIERLRDSPFMTYSVSGIPSAENSGTVYVDSEGRRWFAPSDGGLYWTKGAEVHDVKNDGLDRDVVYSLTGNGDDLWIGRQTRGLTHLKIKDASITARTYTQTDGLVQNSIYTVYQSRDGAVWAGSISGGVSKFKDGKFTNYTAATGLPSNTITAIVEGSDDTIWFATANGLSSFSGGNWKSYGGEDGLPPGRLNCVLEDSDGVLWIGTDNGLALFRSGRIQVPPSVSDALRDPVFGVARDQSGGLWLATSNHVLRVEREKLLDGTVSDADVREFGLADGLRSVQGLRRDRSVVVDRLGQIWFSTHSGISVVDPARVSADSIPALPHIEQVTADGSPLNAQGPIRIRGSRQRITFTYAGLSLSIPERVRFRYKLEPYDLDWSEPRAEREATYTNLEPGSYRFRIMVSNSAGVWSNVESTVQLDIEPMFWQTWWFRVSLLIVAGLTVLLLYRLRLQRLTHQMNVRFEERLAERTRIAQDLHDTLLQGFLSASMQLHVAARQLPADSPAKPRVTRVLELMGQVIEEGRTTLKGLRSTDSSSRDLVQSFSAIQAELPERRHIDYRVTVEGQSRPLHPVIRDEVFHIGREALLNAFRHSQAKTIELELEYGQNQLRVLVRDDGRGIDPQMLHSGREGHCGISGMRERAEEIGAGLKLWSREGAGTEVELSIPARIAYVSDSSRRGRRWWSKLYPHRPHQDGRK